MVVGSWVEDAAQASTTNSATAAHTPSAQGHARRHGATPCSMSSAFPPIDSTDRSAVKSGIRRQAESVVSARLFSDKKRGNFSLPSLTRRRRSRLSTSRVLLVNGVAETQGLASGRLAEVCPRRGIEHAARSADEEPLALRIQTRANTGLQVAALGADAGQEDGERGRGRTNGAQLLGPRGPDDQPTVAAGIPQVGHLSRHVEVEWLATPPTALH